MHSCSGSPHNALHFTSNTYLYCNITARGMIKLHINLSTKAQRVRRVYLCLVECVVIVNSAIEHDPHCRWSEARKKDKLHNLCSVGESAGDFLTVNAECALLYWGGPGNSCIQHVCDAGHGLTGAVAFRGSVGESNKKRGEKGEMD